MNKRFLDCPVRHAASAGCSARRHENEGGSGTAHGKKNWGPQVGPESPTRHTLRQQCRTQSDANSTIIIVSWGGLQNREILSIACQRLLTPRAQSFDIAGYHGSYAVVAKSGSVDGSGVALTLREMEMLPKLFDKG